MSVADIKDVGLKWSGKTTLLRQLEACRGGTYLTLDDGTLRAAAHADPEVFVADGPGPMMIDEIQRGGDDLVLAIKASVDRSPGRGQSVGDLKKIDTCGWGRGGTFTLCR